MVGGYANAWRTTGQRPADIEPDEYCESVAEWLALQDENEEADARTFVVGGCCGIFAEHIEKMREVVDAASRSSTLNPQL